jgi:hypothetical protein
MDPSAKGSIVIGVVASLRGLRRAGRITNDQLAARLSGPAIELLEQKIEVGRWYPMATFAELVDFEWQLVAVRNPEVARESGAKSAGRLFEGGRYQQLDFVERTGKAESRDELVRQAKLITTITAALYNFLQVTVSIDAEHRDELAITYTNASLLCDALRYSTEGFMNGINARQGSPRRWSSERTAPDRIVFRLALPRRLAH